MIKKDAKGYYIIKSLEDLSEWYKITNASPTEKKKHKEDLKKEKENLQQPKTNNKNT